MSTRTTSEQVVAITGRVKARIRAMARTMATDERADVAQMPAEIRVMEVPQTARTIYQANLDALAEDRMLTETELAEARDRGTQRAHEEFPIDLLMHNWSRGAAVLWQGCVDAARDDEQQGLVEIASRLFGLLEQQICVLADAYHSTRSALDRHEFGAAPMVARLLVSGQDASAIAQRAGVELTTAYDVLAVDLAPHPDEHAAQAPALAVAGHRKVQRVLTALDRHAPENVVAALEAGGGQVLVPRPDGDDVDVDRCRALLDLIGTAAGSEATGAACFAPTRDAVPTAVAQASEVLRVARHAGLGPGLHDIASDAVSFQLSLPGRARDHLAATLDPLDPHPELLATIRTLQERDGDRGRTARALGVHPNTVNNRLAKIKELLGFDPVTTRGIVTLNAALTARRLSRTEEDDE